MPPTPNIGNMAMVKTKIPMPPNHCSIALQINIALGINSNPENIVAPVVVSPETASKKARTNDMFSSNIRNGVDDIIESKTQTSNTSVKPSLACSSEEFWE